VMLSNRLTGDTPAGSAGWKKGEDLATVLRKVKRATE
jgi:hypothetical protein